MSYKLFGEKNNQLYKALIAAKYNDVKVENVNASENDLKKSPVGKAPILETAEGILFEPNAIARYFARLGKARLYGTSTHEAGLIEQWIEFAVHEIELPANVWALPVMGKIPHNSQAVNRAKGDLKKAFGILNKHLLSHVYLVGHRVTIADIIVSMTVYHVFELVADAEFRKPFVNLIRWYQGLVNQPEFIAVLGSFKFTDKEQAPKEVVAKQEVPAKQEKSKKEQQAPKEGESAPAHPKKEKKEQQPKKEKAPAQPKKEKEAPKKKEKEEEEDFEEKYEDEEPKKKNPLDFLPKSSFVLDEWKRVYSNEDTRTVAIPWFWEKFDAEGYSIWTGDYKYNEENQVLFMTCNLVGGFIQRLDKLRKYGFGSLLIFGEEAPFEISVLFVFRGQEIPQEMIECDDSEHYDWKKLDIKDPKQKEYINDYFAWDGAFELKKGKKKFNQGKAFK